MLEIILATITLLFMVMIIGVLCAEYGFKKGKEAERKRRADPHRSL